jgi:molybdate transport system substrate-binding protein
MIGILKRVPTSHQLATYLTGFAVLLLFASSAAAQQRGPLVLAAASLQESLSAAADDWAAQGHLRPVISFAASSDLARQVLAGAPADMFISADEEWMDAVAAKGLLRRGTRSSFLTNRLVLIAPVASRVHLTITSGFPLAQALGMGRLAMADPDAVPAGRYGRQALTRLGVWPAVQSRIAPAQNVRAALALVDRGEVPLGIVYATDALADRRVRVVGVFPPSSHAPIIYPMALLTAATNRDADAFRRFLVSGEGTAIFRRFGFGTR